MKRIFERYGSCAAYRNLPMGVLLAFIGLLSAPTQASELTSRTVRCDKTEYRYLLFAPPKSAPSPAIVLLHDAGDRPENMINAWERLAAKEEIVLIAPELPRDPKFEEVAPAVFRCVTENAKQLAKLDPRRIYLFGNSMGGYLTFDGAMFESEYFAAAAVHANLIDDDYFGIVNSAQRKTPIAIYIGDHDGFYPLERVRKTRDLLIQSGFPLHYVELPDHDHDYYALADSINSDAWKFLKQYRLPGS